MGIVQDFKPDDDEKSFESVMKQMLILSHGNAEVERGFLVYKDCLVENKKEE